MRGESWGKKFSDRRQTLRQRIQEVRERVQEGLSYAFDRLLHERMDTYFLMEERLEEFERLFSTLAQEIDFTADVTSFQRLEERFYYLEDSFEELDSELRGRPARRRQGRFNFFNFFRQWQSEHEEKHGQSASEILDAAEAYQILGLAMGSDLKSVTAAFRRLVKGLHPDARDGDRSQEPRLRKLVAAYEFIKRDLRR
jgi:hypothetical protein